MRHIRIDDEVEIDRPPPDVFAFLADQEHRPAWSRGLHRVRRTSDHTYRMAGTAIGRRGEATYEVTGQEPDRSFSGRLSWPRLSCDEAYNLHDEEGRTWLRVKVTARPDRRLSLLAPVLGFLLRRHVRHDLRRLRATLEGPTRKDAEEPEAEPRPAESPPEDEPVTPV
ncbi:MAG: SRPBCC family protein [Acidimicrobiales bacterium]